MIVLLLYFILSSIEYFKKSQDMEYLENQSTIKYIKEKTISGC